MENRFLHPAEGLIDGPSAGCLSVNRQSLFVKGEKVETCESYRLIGYCKKI